MIDLGDELADYGNQPQTPSKPPDGMGSFGRLADLQAGGFNVDPRRADLGDPKWSFTGPGSFTISAEPLTNPRWLTCIVAGAAGLTPPWTASQDQDGSVIEVKTWLPGDDPT